MNRGWNDDDILNAIASSDESTSDVALKYVYQTYYGMIESYVVKNSGSMEEAADVFQDAIMVFYNAVRSNTFRKESGIKTFLYAVARNIWLKRIRKEPKREVLTINVEQIEILEEGSVLDEQINISEVLKNALSELGNDCKSLLVDFYFEKFTMNEIQEKFELGSVQAAKNKKYKCMQKLMKLFKSKGITKEKLFG